MSAGRTAYVIERYGAALKTDWDAFVRTSKNGTFLFERGYMDYHSGRFADHSLVVRSGGEIVALLPANGAGDAVHSHQGLTYGGFITAESMTTPKMLAVFEAGLAYLRRDGFRSLHYKTTPSIYHRLPAEEDRYALFFSDATLSRRDVLSVVPSSARGPVQARRRRGAAKAVKQGVVVSRANDFKPFWALLSEHLLTRFGADPVHSLADIECLRRRFPGAIYLFTAELHGELVAGVVIFESARVAHVQYIASSDLGRATGALDAMFMHLLEQVYAVKPIFDFGISNEQQGRYLNVGLIEQKEGFGARAVMHDFYDVSL